MSFVAELWAFAGARKKFWLLPIIVLFAIIGGLLILVQGSAIAPFIDTIFQHHPHMPTLGISAFYHDSVAVLVADGQIVAAAQE